MPFFRERIEVVHYQQGNPVAELIGAAIGLGVGLFVRHKINKSRRRKHEERTAEGLKAMGYSSEDAVRLAKLDNELVKEVVKGKVENDNQTSGTILQLSELQIMNERLVLQRTVTYAGFIFIFCAFALVAYRVLKK